MAKIPHQPRKRFASHWFWMVFWLTLTATLLISWNMVVNNGGSVVDF